jgi:hypothetical protein
MEDLEKKTEDARAVMKVADALDEIRAANVRRETVEAKPPVDSFAASADAQEAEDAQIAQAALKGKKRSSPEPSLEALKADFSIVRPAKTVKKDFTKTLGIKRRS